MSRRLRIAAATIAALGLGDAATAHAATQPRVARPNPALVAVRLDYVGPILDPQGGTATLAPLLHSVIAAAVADQEFLAFRSADDLGGFKPAPTGLFAGSSGGRELVGRRGWASQLPQFAEAADGNVTSFASVGGGTFTPPDQGRQPVPGLGTPPPVTPPANDNTVPPPNQGFGGTPAPEPPPTTTTTRPPPATRPVPTTPTTTTPTTTTPTTTTPTTTTAATTTSPGPAPTTTTPFVGAACGARGLKITSDHATCLIHAANMAPGGSASEVMTITNDTADPFTLSLRVDGPVNALWNTLRLGVWEDGTAAPSVLPALTWWTTPGNTLTTLQPGETIRYEIELYLPTTATNALQGMTSTINLTWRAQA